MLYIPYPFKCCSKCKQEFIASPRFFPRHRKTKDGLYTQCKDCVNSNAERHTYIKQWGKDNRERKLLRQKERRKNNNRKDYERNYRAKNAETLRQKRKIYEKRNQERKRCYGKEYRKKYPEKHRITEQRRRARERNVPATFVEKDWQRALDYFGGCCAVCGRPQGFWHILSQDHWIPLSKGGGYTPNNIVPLCHGENGCNNEKLNRDPIEWLIERFGPRKAKQILRAIEDYFAWVKHQRTD